MSLVQIPAPRPYSVSLAVAAISSRSLNGAATTTGPKISSPTIFMSGESPPGPDRHGGDTQPDVTHDGLRAGCALNRIGRRYQGAGRRRYALCAGAQGVIRPEQRHQRAAGDRSQHADHE